MHAFEPLTCAERRLVLRLSRGEAVPEEGLSSLEGKLVVYGGTLTVVGEQVGAMLLRNPLLAFEDMDGIGRRAH